MDTHKKTTLTIVALLISILFNALLLWHFHDRFWWPPDEGFSAHTAERILQGEVLNKDIQQYFPGYIDWVHVLGFKFFGKNLLSLRYPLVVISIIQSILVFLLFSRFGPINAVIASLVPTCLGVLQYLNPNAHWYCLFFVILLIFSLMRVKNNKARFISAGFFVAMIFLFRQLNGVFAGIGAISFLLYENQRDEGGKKCILSKVILLVPLFGLIYYLFKTSDALAIIFIGIWPVLILLKQIFIGKTPDQKACDILKNFTYGALIAFLPVLIYHGIHGSFYIWLDDVFIRNFSYLEKDYLYLIDYKILLSELFHSLLNLKNMYELINCGYWFLIFGTFCYGGLAAFDYLFNDKGKCSTKSAVMAIIPVFYAVVSLHNQIPVYIYFTIGLSLLGVLWIRGMRAQSSSKYAWLVAIILCVASLFFHAAQPLSRGFSGNITGETVKMSFSRGRLKNVDLWIDERDILLYSSLISSIQRETNQEDAIFVIPYNPILYFLAERRNPFRFNVFDMGIINEQEVLKLMGDIKDKPPRLVIYDPNDKRNTQFSRTVINQIQDFYEKIPSIGEYEIYKVKDK